MGGGLAAGAAVPGIVRRRLQPGGGADAALAAVDRGIEQFRQRGPDRLHVGPRRLGTGAFDFGVLPVFLGVSGSSPSAEYGMSPRERKGKNRHAAHCVFSVSRCQHSAPPGKIGFALDGSRRSHEATLRDTSWRVGVTARSTRASPPTCRDVPSSTVRVPKGFRRNTVVRDWSDEVHETMIEGIAREKQIKAGSRAKKLALIEDPTPVERPLRFVDVRSVMSSPRHCERSEAIQLSATQVRIASSLRSSQ